MSEEPRTGIGSSCNSVHTNICTEVKELEITTNIRATRNRLDIQLFDNATTKDVVFNDAPNTFHLRLHGVGHVVKDPATSEKGNQLPPFHGLLF